MPDTIKKLMLIILGIMIVCPIFAQTAVANNLQRYNYQYIIQLYDRGESKVVRSEIQKFLAEFPDSDYTSNLRLIYANLLLEDKDYESALAIYNQILDEDLDMSLRHQAYLYRGISLIGLKNYKEAILQLQILESETMDDFLLAQSNLHRARIYKILGQYYSAMHSYQVALNYVPDPDVEYEYLEVLINLQKDDEALQILNKISPESQIYAKSHVLWAQYLLEDNRFAEFDELIHENPALVSHPHIELLSLRKAIALGEYSIAEEILATTENYGDHFEYYNGLLLVEQGDLKEADFIFSRLVREAEPEIRVLSYLERLKIIFREQPEVAIALLDDFIAQDTSIAKAEQLMTMGYFAFEMQDYPQALKYLSAARVESQNRLQMAEIDIFIARSWLLAKNEQHAIESFNRYLNLYQHGKDRDTAHFYLGYLYFEAKDYKLSAANFEQIVTSYPQSRFVASSKLYLAEIDFYLANYNLALEAYQQIIEAEPENSYALLRIAQIYYYIGEYDQAEATIQLLEPSYDSVILQGHIAFYKKSYDSALEHFEYAEELAGSELKITEAKSYQALCLYQMKRYTEATAIYLQLFQGKESPDTYLYLGAKSAYASGDYHLALSLFDDFIDSYPESQYFLLALADIANCYYNMGNYAQALEDYRNILLRFRNTKEFSSTDQSLLSEVFTGIELTLNRLDDPVLALEIAELADTFQSQFIRFELSYLVLKIYAEGEQWNDVLSAAEELRKDFPHENRTEVELIMAESLLHLSEYEEAEHVLADLYEDTKDQRALLQWAEVDLQLGDYEAALTKYKEALTTEPSATLWEDALAASVAANYLYFDEIWAMGQEFEKSASNARIMRLAQLSNEKRFKEANAMADTIINESLNSYDHANAFYYKALILFLSAKYEEAIGEFDKVLVLFPDYEDVIDLAAYHKILCYLNMNAKTEAEMQLLELGDLLSNEHKEILNEIMQDTPDQDIAPMDIDSSERLENDIVPKDMGETSENPDKTKESQQPIDKDEE
nr:hypothetical protein [Candidatus Cloacimonadota bacterium]